MPRIKLVDSPTDSKPAVKRIESSVEAAAVIVEVALPKDLYETYQASADAQGISLEDALISRLRRCAGHDSIRGLYLGDSDRRKLESTLKKQPIESTAQLMALLDSIFSIRVDKFNPVQISGAAYKRLALRDGFGGLTAQQHLDKLVRDALVKALGVF